MATRFVGMSEPALQSTVRCPACRVETTAIMPTDACVFFWSCPACEVVVRPKAGDCCVFLLLRIDPLPAQRTRVTPCLHRTSTVSDYGEPESGPWSPERVLRSVGKQV